MSKAFRESGVLPIPTSPVSKTLNKSPPALFFDTINALSVESLFASMSILKDPFDFNHPPPEYPLNATLPSC